jgi:hypothetical protein
MITWYDLDNVSWAYFGDKAATVKTESQEGYLWYRYKVAPAAGEEVLEEGVSSDKYHAKQLAERSLTAVA